MTGSAGFSRVCQLILSLQCSGAWPLEAQENALEQFQPRQVAIQPVDNKFGAGPTGEAFGPFVAEWRLTSDAGRRSPYAEFALYPKGKHVKISSDSVHFPRSSWYAQRLMEREQEQHGPFQNGDIIPMFGSLYRAEWYQPKGDAGDLILSRIEKENWPEGIILDPFARPVLTNGCLRFPSAQIRCLFDEKNRRFRLLVPSWKYLPKTGNALETTEIDVVVGKVVTVPIDAGGHFKVISVVLPDDQIRIPGWVELRRVWPNIVPFGVEQDLELR